MPYKLTQKLQNEDFITWAQYSNVVGIIVSVLMIAGAFYSVRMEVVELKQIVRSHIEYSQETDRRISKMLDTLNEQQARVTRLETIENIK